MYKQCFLEQLEILAYSISQLYTFIYEDQEDEGSSYYPNIIVCFSYFEQFKTAGQDERKESIALKRKIIKYIIGMDPTKNIKSIQANLQFLKRFEGKKSIITRDGLISSLQSDPLPPFPSPRKIRINEQKLLQKVGPFPFSSPQKFVSTEPSAEMDINIDFLNSEIQPGGKKRIEQGSKHSNRSQRPTKTVSNQPSHDLQLFRERLNRSDKLPRLVKSRSDHNMPRSEKMGSYVRSLSKGKNGSLPNYEVQLNKDMSAASYFKQLQKFESSLRNLKIKTDKKAAQFAHN